MWDVIATWVGLVLAPFLGAILYVGRLGTRVTVVEAQINHIQKAIDKIDRRQEELMDYLLNKLGPHEPRS